MKNLLKCSSLVMIGIIALVVALVTSLKPEVFAQGNSGNAGNNSITEKIDQHDTDIKVDIVQHEAEIKADIAQHDTDVYNDITAHDGNMTEEHGILSDEHDNLDTKLDQIVAGGGECPDCPDAWDKLLTTDRFALVMNGEAFRDNETCLVWELAPGDTDVPFNVITPDDRTDWVDGYFHCNNKTVGGRKGWRYPTIAELASLIDPNTGGPPFLPAGHPFQDVQTSLPDYYWSSTTNAFNNGGAWVVSFAQGNGSVTVGSKNLLGLRGNNFVWCVRGGQGHDGYSVH